MPDRYFQINDDVGIDPDGNPEPLHEIGLVVNIPTMKDDEVVEVAQRATIKPIPGTRTFKTGDLLIADAMLDCGLVHEIDAPSKSDVAAERKTTQDARDNSGTHTDDEPGDGQEA